MLSRLQFFLSILKSISDTHLYFGFNNDTSSCVHVQMLARVDILVLKKLLKSLT